MDAILDITAFSGFTIRLALAIVLGFIVGFERQWTKHQAGILTNVIVCVGAYAYTALSWPEGFEFHRIHHWQYHEYF